MMDDFEEQTLKELKTTKAKVRALLAKEMRVRNDDRWLLFQYWKSEGIPITIQDDMVVFSVPLDQFYLITNPETVRRVRQEIQNVDGEFLPTDVEVMVKRRIKQDIIHAYYGKDREIMSDYNRIVLGVK